MFGCCCSPVPEDYRIRYAEMMQGAPVTGGDYFAPCGFAVVGFSGGWAAGPGHLLAVDSILTNHIWRRYTTRVTTRTTPLGYTQVTTESYHDILSRTVTTDSIVYTPDETTYNSDSGTGGGIDTTSEVSETEILYTYPSGLTLRYQWSGLITDAAVFAALQSDKLSTVDWGTAPSVASYGGTNYTLPGVPAAIATSGADDAWTWGTPGGVSWSTYKGQLDAYFIAKPSNPAPSQYVYAYALRAVRRSPLGKGFWLAQLRTNAGVCIQRSTLNASGCPTSYVYETAATDIIDADDVSLMTDVSETGPLTWDGSHWVLTSEVVQVAAALAVPYAGAAHSTVAGCSGAEETRYRYYGAQISVPTTASSGCTLPPP